ncbi:hypothetical protein ACJX0J_014171 [Zea mays]
MVSTVFILCAKSRKHPPFCLPENISTIFIHSLPRMLEQFFFQFTLFKDVSKQPEDMDIFSAKPTHQIISMQSARDKEIISHGFFATVFEPANMNEDNVIWDDEQQHLDREMNDLLEYNQVAWDEELYKQVAELASKLVVEEAAYRDKAIGERGMKTGINLEMKGLHMVLVMNLVWRGQMTLIYVSKLIIILC